MNYKYYRITKRAKVNPHTSLLRRHKNDARSNVATKELLGKQVHLLAHGPNFWKVYLKAVVFVAVP